MPVWSRGRDPRFSHHLRCHGGKAGGSEEVGKPGGLHGRYWRLQQCQYKASCRSQRRDPARTHHIEMAQQLDPAWFEGVKIVGITAGASTPKWIIDEVLEQIESIAKDKNR